MLSIFSKTSLLFFGLAVAVYSLRISNDTVEAVPHAAVKTTGSFLANFVNTNELISIQRNTPLEQIEWTRATNSLSSSEEHEKTVLQRHMIGSKLSRRYVDLTKCSNDQGRLVLRDQLRSVVDMLQDAQRNLTLAHPVWRSLIASQFRNEPRALQRMQNLFSVLRIMINDPSHTVTLTCNAATPQCVQKREGPADGREQVPAAYFSSPDNAVNFCDGFFSMPHLEQMDCIEGAPMSEYESAGKGLSF